MYGNRIFFPYSISRPFGLTNFTSKTYCINTKNGLDRMFVFIMDNIANEIPRIDTNAYAVFRKGVSDFSQLMSSIVINGTRVVCKAAKS